MGREQRFIAADMEPYRLPLTVRDFLILDEAGAFDKVGKVELIEGELYTMAPLHHPHARAQMMLGTAVDLAVEQLGGEWQALAPMSAELEETSLPEADSIVAYAPGDRFVTPETVRLLIEVASTSLGRDLGKKLRLYARTGVPEYWVADVNGREIIRFHAPSGESYTQRATFAFGEAVPSATIPGLTVDTARLR